MSALSNPRVVSFSGTRGAGKDTAADLMAEKLADQGMAVARFSFAGEVYKEIARAFSVSVESLQWRASKELPQDHLTLFECANRDFWPVAIEHISKWRKAEGKGPINVNSALSPRELLRCWGTQFRRDSEHGHLRYWIDRVQELIKNRPEVDVWVCSDCRLDNERDFLLSLGASMCRVNASHLNENDDEICATGHESDTQWRKWDYDQVLMNQWGDLSVLNEQLFELQAQSFPTEKCSI